MAKIAHRVSAEFEIYANFYDFMQILCKFLGLTGGFQWNSTWAFDEKSHLSHLSKIMQFCKDLYKFMQIFVIISIKFDKNSPNRPTLVKFALGGESNVLNRPVNETRIKMLKFTSEDAIKVKWMKTKRSVVDMLMMRLLNAHWAHLQTSEGHAIVLRVFPDFGYRLIDAAAQHLVSTFNNIIQIKSTSIPKM